MRILIVEDEDLIAQRIKRLTQEILGNQLQHLAIHPTFESAQAYIQDHPLDILMLDLNLNGVDGFQLLEKSVAQSFQTIILSAYPDRAIMAYEYGVLDFIAKPFNKTRLQKAFERYQNQQYRAEHHTKYLAVKKRQKLHLVAIEDIAYLQGAGNHSELHLTSGQIELHDKSLQHIVKLLPQQFKRVHKSYIVNMQLVRAISSQYEITLENDACIPISRTQYKQLKDLLS